MNSKPFEGVKCLILDMDGTVYLGHKLIRGSDRFLNEIAKGALTLNSSQTIPRMTQSPA